MPDATETDVSEIVFEMEDQLRTARDFASLVETRLGGTEPIDEHEKRCLCRTAVECALSLDATISQWERLTGEIRP